MNRKRFTPEFKHQAVQKLASGNYTLKQLSAELGVSVVSLLKWRDQSIGPRTNPGSSSGSSEVEQLRAELARVQEECARLRKGIACLAGLTG